MNPALPVLIISAIIMAAALGEVTQGMVLQGTECSPAAGDGKVASDHTAVWVQETVTSTTSWEVGDVAGGCLVDGASLAVQVLSPAKSVTIEVVEYTIGYAAHDVWTPPVFNGTRTAANLTAPGFWTNTTVEYWADPSWGHNVSISANPYTFVTAPLTLPPAYSEKTLFIGYDGANWTFWYATPASALPLAGTVGGEYGTLTSWLILLGVAAGLAIGTGAAAMEDLLAPPRRKGAGLVVLLLLVVAATIGGSYLAYPDAWAQHLGSGWSYLLLLLPEYWALTALVVFVWPAKAQLQGEYRDDGEITEHKWDAIDLPAVWVIRKPGIGLVHVPRGAVQALKRLALGEKAYIRIRDKVRTPSPAYVAVNGVVSSLVVLGGEVKTTYPHAEFFARDPLPPGVPLVDAEGHENRGRLRIVRWVEGERRRPVLSVGGTKAILDRLAERREVDQIAGDVTDLEDDVVDARAEMHVGAARRGRQLLKDFLLASWEESANAPAATQAEATVTAPPPPKEVPKP